MTLLFFCSGVLALIYEVLWQRDFALVFGSGGPAVAAVLAAYFAGLGAGSLVIGSRSVHWSRPLFTYALLELLIGIGALLVPAILLGYEKLYPWLFANLAAQPFLFAFLKTTLAFIALGLPTFCMGGTLPVLAQLVGGERNLGLTAGWLYAVNTFGAALGALCVPFLLLPRLGMHGSLGAAVLGNIAVAFIAWRLSRHFPPVKPSQSTEAAHKEISQKSKENDSPAVEKESEWLGRFWLHPVWGLSFLSGLVIFALQVLWNRAFAQVHENSIYSFAVIAAVFILALAVGAQLARAWLRHRPQGHLPLGLAWVFGAFLTIIGPWLFLHLTNNLSYLPTGSGWMNYAGKLTLLALEVLLAPIMLLGMVFPLLLDRQTSIPGANPGKRVGKLLTANILGSVSGSLLAGFLFPRLFGLWNSIFLIGTLLAIAGAWQLSFRWPPKLASLIAGGGLFWFCTQADLPRVKVAIAQNEHTIAVAEGVYGIAGAVERPNSRRLKLNNYYVLGGTSSVGDERMQAHIPLLVHPSPHRVAFLGLGTGITAGGSSFHPVEQLTIVEMVPEVVALARSHFAGANTAILEEPKTRIIVEDARNYLRGTSEKFDVLIGDLVVPWREGEGALFSLEHFRAARQRLATGGIFCVWLPCFQLSEEELTLLARTFLTVFPKALVFRGDFSPIAPAIAFIGGIEPFQMDPRVIAARLSQMRLDPTNPQLREPLAFWMHFVGLLELKDLLGDTSQINRENRPLIELSGPMRHAGSEPGLLITGRRLQSWQNGLQQKHPVPGSVDLDQKIGFEAGNLLYEYTLLLSEHRQTEARSVETKLKTLLPATLSRSLFP